MCLNEGGAGDGNQTHVSIWFAHIRWTDVRWVPFPRVRAIGREDVVVRMLDHILLTGLTVPPRWCLLLNQNWITFPNWIKLNCFWFISVQFSAGSTKTLLSLEYARLCISMNGDETRRFSRRRKMVRTAGFEPTIHFSPQNANKLIGKVHN